MPGDQAPPTPTESKKHQVQNSTVFNLMLLDLVMVRRAVPMTGMPNIPYRGKPSTTSGEDTRTGVTKLRNHSHSPKNMKSLKRFDL